ncbi:hypothetical protein HRbin39_00624 [bacterium HR39]|nr:hypothetical protein HRbin39_00624 [bacterium HR39]
MRSLAARWLAVSLLLLAPALPARAVDLYAVGGIRVDVEAGSAVAARELAFAEARREGLRRLLRRLTLPEDRQRLPDPREVDPEALVAGIEVEEEKLSATRYVATLRVRFSGERVQELLRARGIPALLRPSDPVLVVAVLERPDGSRTVFEEMHPWRQAWLGEGTHDTVLTLVFPLGDVADIVALAQAGGAPAPEVPERFGERYGTRAVLLATARLLGQTSAPEAEPVPTAAEVEVVPVGEWPGGVHRFTLAARPEEDADAFWRRAVREAMARLEEDWKRHDIVRAGEVVRVALVLPLADVGEWVQIRRTLERAPEVRRLDVRRVTRREIRFSVEVLGGEERLRRLLAAGGFEAIPEADGWLLRRAAEGAGR